LGLQESADQKSHGAFLQPAIQQLMQSSGILLKDLDAISVTEGPGSYTGLRVGMASAKGLCYALQKPLITINTLKVIALAAKQSLLETQTILDINILFCPMIDARRMEVFTAIFNHNLEEIVATNAKILDEAAFQDLIQHHTMIFSGTGAFKLRPLLDHPNAKFIATQHNASTLSILALEAFENKFFADLAYSEPNYGKAFYSPPSKK
jgi:tRNA threonylcarbamoyladenosine biosynthesis protein TsaB